MKYFNITGTCIPEKHYMVDTSKKMEQILKMIERRDYFVINRPRQYGKTTTLSQLEDILLASEDYLPIVIGFEGYGEVVFSSEAMFCPAFLMDLGNEFNVENQGYSNLFLEHMSTTDTFQKLSIVIKNILTKIPKKVVLMIDEVDKSSNNELFIHFLGMLREKYLKAAKGRDITFHSIILAGVNDIKTLKQKIRPEAQSQQNSPWNIAVPFNVDMTFHPAEIETMLIDYVNETHNPMDTKSISERIYFWTNGYPFLVSNMCKITAEQILPNQQDKTWDLDIIDNVAKMMIYEKNTLMEVIFKNLESYPDLYKLMEDLALGCEEQESIWQNPLIDQALMYGFIIYNGDRKVRIHNKIFQQSIIDYFISKNKTKSILYNDFNTPSQYVKPDGKLDFEKILLSFQQVIKEKYSNDLLTKDDDFLESDLRLLFLVFLKPIINGYGHSFQEVEIGGEKRLDVVVTFREEKFVVELKVWRGPKYHAEGKERLMQYMQTMSINKGYMLIMTKTKKKTFINEYEDGMLMVYV